MQKLIGRFFPGCIKRLPLSCDCGWTPLEMIMKLNQKLNEIITYLDTNTPATEQWVTEQIENALKAANAYTDEQIGMVRTDFEEFQQTVEQYMADQTKAFEDFKKEQQRNYDAFILSVTTKIAAIQAQVESNNAYIKRWVENELNAFIARMEELYPPVYNPTTGGMDSLQNTLNDMWSKLLYYALTAIEYDNLKLTAEEYDSKKLTAIQYDMWGKKYLTIDMDLYMFDPFTGELVRITTVINKLATFHYEAPLTAAEYDALQITAAAYDAKMLTAWDYDNKGKSLLT